MELKLDKIIREWSYRTETGIPDIKNYKHIRLLSKVLEELNYPPAFIFEYIGELMKESSAEVVGATLAQAREKAEKGQTYTSKLSKKVYTRGKEDEGPEIVGGEEEKEKKEEEESKDKSLKKDFNTGGSFNSEDQFTKTGITDEEFSNNPNIKLQEGEPFKFTEEQTGKFFGDETKFPKRYVKTLERLMSLSKSGNTSITDVVKNVGAGEFSSQAGELVTMMGATIKDPETAKEFFDSLREYEKGTKSPIVDKSWINSAEKVRKGLFARYNDEFGKGNWEIEGGAWDNKEEVEGLGLNDYGKNKGFSTDIYYRIKDKKTGKSVLDEVSLKKDTLAHLLNGTTGRVLDLIIRGNASPEEEKDWAEIINILGPRSAVSKLSPEQKKKYEEISSKYGTDKYGFSDLVDVGKAKERQSKYHEEALKNPDFKSKVSSASNKLTDEQKIKVAKSMSTKEKDVKSILASMEEVPSVLKNLSSPVTLSSIQKSMKKAGLKADPRKTKKMSIIMMKLASESNPEGKIAQDLKRITDNSREHSKEVAKLLISNPKAKAGLLKSIRENLPLKSLMDGEEKMSLGELSADSKTLEKVFGTNDFNELEKGLSISDQNTPPPMGPIDPPGIVYKIRNSDGTTKGAIPIAKITNRPDGIGYGDSWKLEFSVHKEFANALRKANEDLGRL